MGQLVRLPGAGEQCAGWMWNGTNWVWTGEHPHPPPPPCPPPPCPPHVWPPHHPRPPMPPPGGCVPPDCTDWLAMMQKCWNDSQALTDFLEQVITDIFTNNPGIIPSPPPSAGSGPIIGVTDGSNAAPGEVGEFVQTSTIVSFTAAAQTQSINAAILQPGDWDAWCSFLPTAWVAGCQFILSPQPTGVSSTMQGIDNSETVVTGVPVSENDNVVLGIPARASISVPTLFAFTLNTNFLASGNGSTNGVFLFGARRRR